MRFSIARLVSTSALQRESHGERHGARDSNIDRDRDMGKGISRDAEGETERRWRGTQKERGRERAGGTCNVPPV